MLFYDGLNPVQTRLVNNHADGLLVRRISSIVDVTSAICQDRQVWVILLTPRISAPGRVRRRFV